jgi:hypothetical protein
LLGVACYKSCFGLRTVVSKEKKRKEKTMSHPLKKKQRLDHYAVTFDDLSADLRANIFSFLPPKDIMRSRRINKTTSEAVKKTVVPLQGFRVGNMMTYNAMVVMTRAMPNLQQITLHGLGRGHKYNDGEDPDERCAARTASWAVHDIEIISNFSKLQTLEIATGINGRYPFLFNSFPLLEKLVINSAYLKFDLEMLAGFPLLKELTCRGNNCLTGNINSLRVLKDTLEKVDFCRCQNVEGNNLMDLADFPNLKELNLRGSAVIGDIRDIGENDFLSLENLYLPDGVYGCKGYQFQRISEATDLVRTLHLLKKQRPALSMLQHWDGTLSKDSPDWYESIPERISFVQAGSRIGYRWEDKKKRGGDSCEVNWLDPDPDRESSDYAKYAEDLQKIESRVTIYKGFQQPPTEEEYRRLVEEHAQRG